MFQCLAVDIGAGSGRIMRCVIDDNKKITLDEIARFGNESRERMVSSGGTSISWSLISKLALQKLPHSENPMQSQLIHGASTTLCWTKMIS